MSDFMDKVIVNGVISDVVTGTNDYNGESYIIIGGKTVFIDSGRYSPSFVRSALLNFSIVGQYVEVMAVSRNEEYIAVGFYFSSSVNEI